MKAPLDELRELLLDQWAVAGSCDIPRLAMVVGEVPRDKLDAVYEPMLNFVVQGGKSLTIGGQTLDYDPQHYFLMTVDLPASGTLHDAGAGLPYIALALTLEPQVISGLVAEVPRGSDSSGAAFSVSPVTPEMTDAWLRMARLMGHPDQAGILAPMIEREILFRVLQGPQGWMLRQIARSDSQLSRLHSIIRWMRQHYAEPLRMEVLAVQAGMSLSAFHRCFKAATALSPLQFQKQLRLLEAKRLLTTTRSSASTAAYSVGYESPSQFGREYLRRFGCSPRKDQADSA